MDFSGTEPSLLVPEACSWGVTRGHRVDKGGVSWGDVACGTLRSPDVGEPPPPTERGSAQPFAFTAAIGATRCGSYELGVQSWPRTVWKSSISRTQESPESLVPLQGELERIVSRRSRSTLASTCFPTAIPAAMIQWHTAFSSSLKGSEG